MSKKFNDNQFVFVEADIIGNFTLLPPATSGREQGRFDSRLSGQLVPKYKILVNGCIKWSST